MYSSKYINFLLIFKKSPKKKNKTKVKHTSFLKVKLRIQKAYSSMAERTAHNGQDVGSNPAKPNNFFLIVFKLKNMQ